MKKYRVWCRLCLEEMDEETGDARGVCVSDTGEIEDAPSDSADEFPVGAVYDDPVEAQEALQSLYEEIS